MRLFSRFLVLLFLAVPFVMAAEKPDAAHQISPEDFARQLKFAQRPPLIFNIGPRSLYDQAHIRGAEYIGAGSTDEGRAKLSDRVKTLPKDIEIVLYCGCCPWDHCPNVGPAFAILSQLGFTKVKVMYVAHNIGTDWVDKGYPTEKGK